MRRANVINPLCARRPGLAGAHGHLNSLLRKSITRLCIARVHGLGFYVLSDASRGSGLGLDLECQVGIGFSADRVTKTFTAEVLAAGADPWTGICVIRNPRQ